LAAFIARPVLLVVNWLLYWLDRYYAWKEVEVISLEELTRTINLKLKDHGR
jgi:hypothetical protein